VSEKILDTLIGAPRSCTWVATAWRKQWKLMPRSIPARSRLLLKAVRKLSAVIGLSGLLP